MDNNQNKFNEESTAGSLNSEMNAYNEQNSQPAADTSAPATEPTPVSQPAYNTYDPYNPYAGTGTNQVPYTAQPMNNGFIEQKPSTGYAVASLVLGIVSIVCCCGCLNIIPAVLAIIFSIVDKKKNGAMSGMAIAGLICGIIGCAFGIIGTLVILLDSDFWISFEEGYKAGYEAAA